MISGRRLMASCAPVSLADARELAPIYCGTPCADDFLTLLVNKAGGSVRRVCVNLDAVREAAAEQGTKAVDLEWCKAHNVVFYTGDAPKRRVA